MALLHPVSSSFPVSSGSNSPISGQPNLPVLIRPMPISRRSSVNLQSRTRKRTHHLVVNSIEGREDNESVNSIEGRGDNEAETESTQQSNDTKASNDGDLSKLGEDIKSAMKERKEREDKNLWSGVAEEIREIEWPAFGKVLRTTGVVLGVIAGSSVVLLTVNAVLAELSDRVFVGKGVQDFFS